MNELQQPGPTEPCGPWVHPADETRPVFVNYNTDDTR